ncbi:MAG: peptidoglycan-binding domain-containing protein [Chromatiaceae bacterium]
MLAFAKHYLTVESGGATPEEDFLFHFLGAGQARQVLALARGEARDTLCVKPSEAAGDDVTEMMSAKAPLQALPRVAREPALVPPLVPDVPRRTSQPEPETRRELPTIEVSKRTARTRTILQTMPPIAAEPAIFFPFAPEASAVSSQWGLPADSPTVTGNLGMFYRDGKGQTDPYTWTEFMDHLALRVRAENQPALVRAKYGVGFELKGGDTPERAFNPKTLSEAAAFRDENGQAVLVPEALVTGPLNRDETRQYRQRLAALVSTGEDEPSNMPPESLSALHDLGVLSPNARQVCPTDTQVQKALRAFRSLVGKAEPDDPSQRDLLMPAERVALEIYGQRLARYAGLQARQLASSLNAPDLNRIGKMPEALRRSAAPHVAALQNALADQGLLTRPIKKSVWRDKKRKKHVSYKTLPFAGKPDKATVAALGSFQLRNGLRRTQGVLDAVTLEMLGMPPLGADIFLPLSGPQCALEAAAGAPSTYGILVGDRRSESSAFSPIQRPAVPSVSSCILGPDLCGSAIAEADTAVSQPRKSKGKTKKRRK